MIGKKTKVYLGRRLESWSEGTPTVTYNEITSFYAVLAPISGIEMNRYDKETVSKVYKLGFDYKALGETNLDEIKERNRIRIGKKQYDIIWCHNVGNRYWVLHVEKIDEAL